MRIAANAEMMSVRMSRPEGGLGGIVGVSFVAAGSAAQLPFTVFYARDRWPRCNYGVVPGAACLPSEGSRASVETTFNWRRLCCATHRPFAVQPR